MATEPRWTLRTCHIAAAVVLAAFMVLHLANHIVGLAGQAHHVAFMRAIRPLYRNAVVEPLLLALFASQAVSGVLMVVRGWRSRHGRIAWLQAGSGIYLAVFVLFHAIAVVSGRFALGLDTDFRFAAAGFHVPGWPWFFWPYYTLAVFALFAHLGCAIHWHIVDRHPGRARMAVPAMILAGAVLGLLIASALAGKLYSVDVPAPYRTLFTGA